MLFLLLFTTAFAVIIDESKIKEFKWRGPPVIDETIFTNPNSFDYDFNDDLSKPADMSDIYDQNLGQLPNFNLFKLGKNEGVTRLPIVTRKWQTWSTVANTRGPLDFFATPSTPVSPVFVSTEEPLTTKRMRTTLTTTSAPTSTRRTTTTTVATTTSEATTQPPATTTIGEVTTTRKIILFQREKIVAQPPSVFKSGRGPIWRKGGRIEFEESVTTLQPTPTSQSRNTFISFTRRPLTIPGFVRGFGNRHSFRNRDRLETTTAGAIHFTEPPPTTAVPLRAIQTQHNVFNHQAAPKPVIIHHGATRYRGPTYNCRVMNPFEDGVASPEHNPNCKMLYPGMSADGECRCFYKVSGRDEHGCATGFFYACKPIYLHSVVV